MLFKIIKQQGANMSGLLHNVCSFWLLIWFYSGENKALPLHSFRCSVSIKKRTPKICEVACEMLLNNCEFCESDLGD